MVNYIDFKTLLRKVYQKKGTALLLSIGFLLLTVASAWQLLGTLSSNFHNPKQNLTATSSQAAIPCIVCSLPNDHLFGVYDASLQSLPETQLQLILQGTIDNATNPDLSYAIIASASLPAKIYKIGQIVPGGAKIQRILKDKIIINDNGSLEYLRLPIPKIISDGAST